MRRHRLVALAAVAIAACGPPSTTSFDASHAFDYDTLPCVLSCRGGTCIDDVCAPTPTCPDSCPAGTVCWVDECIALDDAAGIDAFARDATSVQSDAQASIDAVTSTPDVVAPADAATPADAACAIDCGPDHACCGGQCIRITGDRNNCGGCGIVCRADLTCSGGACRCGGFLCDIPGPEANVCTDVNTDFMHCGSCERPCPGGHGYTRCVGGVCMP